MTFASCPDSYLSFIARYPELKKESYSTEPAANLPPGTDPGLVQCNYAIRSGTPFPTSTSFKEGCEQSNPSGLFFVFAPCEW